LQILGFARSEAQSRQAYSRAAYEANGRPTNREAITGLALSRAAIVFQWHPSVQDGFVFVAEQDLDADGLFPVVDVDDQRQRRRRFQLPASKRDEQRSAIFNV
jgi:hypothetical protein